MKYHVSHITTFIYGEPVPLGHNEAHLTPRTFGPQTCLVSQLNIRPVPIAVHHWTDLFGNQVSYFSMEQEHRDLSVSASSVVELNERPVPDPNATMPWEEVRAMCERPTDAAALAAAPFRFESPLVKKSHELGFYARDSFRPGRPILAAALELTERIFREFKYDPAATVINTPTAEVFQQRRGVCQDFAHLEIACLRSLGLPIRYVSGYLMTTPPPGKAKLIGADASHAWVSIFCPGAGWIDLDPTNNQIPQLQHVTLAWGRDYGDVCPVKGVFLGGGSHHTMSVAVDVEPYEQPLVG
ncbi:MAG: transglutaminase family protein [Planctomycetes bacterium]|nr:transglutaminase family protein [Planctomycetota bacterium]